MMKIPTEHEAAFLRLPFALRELVIAELASGNAIAEFGYGFPAAPCGAYVKLAKPVSSRERASDDCVQFYDRDSSDYSGEFTDVQRHFFVMEPPHLPKLDPDNDAVNLMSDFPGSVSHLPPAEASLIRDLHEQSDDRAEREIVPESNLPTNHSRSLVSTFFQSMEMNLDKWHDGQGFDLSVLQLADQNELHAIEQIVLSHSPCDWRDIEVLSLLRTEISKKAILAAFANGDAKVRMAVHRFAYGMISDEQRADSIIRALQESEIHTGLTETLSEVEDFHPPEVIRALFHGLVNRDGATACHFAAMLYFLHGQAKSSFDWDHRPFFLRFNTHDGAERKRAACELCEKVGVNPIDCLQ